MLDRELQVGPVSWMIPISRALQAGGIQAAYDCYAEIKESGNERYTFDVYELEALVYQMLSAGKTDLAIEVLKLNLQAFPDHFGTYLFLARLFLKKGEHAWAEEVLRKALVVQPENANVLDLLEKVRLAASLC